LLLSVGVTMSLHKLTAGSGYDYLTRQVAAQDATELGQPSLASYYSAKGEAPGVWVGAGMAGLEGLSAGDGVSAEQMANLFGNGWHPLAEQLRQRAADQGCDVPGQERAAWLGAPYRVYAGDVPVFRRLVAAAVADLNASRGLPADAPVSLEDRARVRTRVAVDLFAEEFGRSPADAREVAATIARHSRPRTTAVAGFDLTFSPVKSVSALWAVADPHVAGVIERAHTRAVHDALAYLERAALYTREGTNGVRQVETRGLVAAAFTHRDSRAGDPDLHTHVAVANKVQTRDTGRWLAVDGRVLFKAAVTASETYNTRLEHHLHTALGVRFAERPGRDARKRPVREIVGVDPALNARWSSRRVSIEARRRVLASRFQAAHGRPPTPVESIQLAQQATLETRQAKHEPRSLAEQRAAWAEQAREVLGGDRRVTRMIRAALNPPKRDAERVDAAWVARTAAEILATLQERRSHWQAWHVHAEALRRVRGADLPTTDLDPVVALLVGEVLTGHSVALTRPGDDVDVPAALRRSDGASVYTVAGSAQYTSPALLTAEARVVARTGQRDGRRAPTAAVEAALQASAAAGVPLNAGQAALVREMATSGARVRLAIAPAGAGKTTAMRALTGAWVRGGGTVVGLAPSAAAAIVLGESTGAPTDTIAKLIWHLDHPTMGELPGWARRVGPRSLVVVDEAGMADTLSLAKVVEFVTGRGGSVRLVGDDQQLAAVGAGGVLRDITATHGALQLSELMRFTDPAEGAASLALRDGLPEALGFYLDRDRVHVGDLTTLTDDVFTAWRHSHTTGRDALMLAPTRDLVSELNQRARAHRLTTHPQPNSKSKSLSRSRTVTLADGNLASAGDTVITRTNDRTLRTSATDWVKNGDRWHVTGVARCGAVTVRHTRTHRRVTLPADYVAESVELGYAATIHTAQGVTADTSHTLLTGAESRQLAYTALTRGRHANHLYLQVVGDGDEHSILRPDHTHPPAATDLLERLLARDGSSRSAGTLRRDAEDPATLLGDAAARYVDSLHVAAEHHLGAAGVARLDSAADRVLPDLTRAPAWPALRAHLLLRAAHGLDPVAELHTAATFREVETAGDVAAVLDWRLDDTGLRSAGTGPLPWLPGVPDALSDHPDWGPYLAARAARVRDLRDQVAEQATSAGELPGWARQGQARPPADLLTDVALWRAATAVPEADRRPTGPRQLAKAPQQWQAALNARLAGTGTPALAEWAETFDHVLVHPRRDPFTPLLAQRLSAISRAGLQAPTLLRRALAQGPLPDDHQTAALWWRIARHLSPAVAAHVDTDHHLNTTWTTRLPDLVGADHAAVLRDSSWWPALVTVVDHALARGNTLEALLTQHRAGDEDVDPCQALLWRISLRNDPPPTTDERDTWPALHDPPPEPSMTWDDRDDPDHHPEAPSDTDRAQLHPLHPDEPPAPATDDVVALDVAAVADTTGISDDEVEATLTWAALARGLAGPLEPTDREIDTEVARAHEADTAPVSPERILQLNRLAVEFYAARFPGSWAQAYLAERLRTDLTGHPHVRPGYAPAGWTTLVTHLRRHGVTDLELTKSGLASTARTGRLIDRFRDRLVLPITRLTPSGELEPLGFVGRRNPHLDGTEAGPKYLNTPDIPLFHKGAQLYTAREHLDAGGATPVLVEGPLDALAVTLAGNGRFLGVAPLGTALTEQQATQLARLAHQHRQDPVVATDADLAGQIAAERDYWLLTQHHLNPNTVALRPGSDPADVLACHGPQALQDILDSPSPLADTLVTDRLTNLPAPQAARQAAGVLAAGHPTWWDTGVDRIADKTGLPPALVRRQLAAAVRQWGNDPRALARQHIADLPSVRARVSAADSLPSHQEPAVRQASRTTGSPVAPSADARPVTPRR
jgi:DNA primase catalytic core